MENRPLLQLPLEVIEEIVDWLRVQELLELQLTCKSLRSVVGPRLWENLSLNVGDIEPKGPTVTGRFTNTNPFDEASILMITDTDRLKDFAKLIFSRDKIVFSWIRRLSVNIQSFIQMPAQTPTLSSANSFKIGLTNFVYWFLLQIKQAQQENSNSSLICLDVRTALGRPTDNWKTSIVSFLMSEVSSQEIYLTMSFYRPLHGQGDKLIPSNVTKIVADVRHFNSEFFLDLRTVCGETLPEYIRELSVFGIGEHRELCGVDVEQLSNFLGNASRLEKLRLSNFEILPSMTKWVPESITYLGISQDLGKQHIPDDILGQSTLIGPCVKELDVRTEDGRILKRISFPNLETLTLRKRGPYTPTGDYIMGEEDLVDNMAVFFSRFPKLNRLNFEDISIPCLKGIVSQSNGVIKHLCCDYSTFTTISKPAIHSIILDIAEYLPRVETVEIDFSIDLGGQSEYPLSTVVAEYICRCPNLRRFDIKSIKFPVSNFSYLFLDKDASTAHVDINLFKASYI